MARATKTKHGTPPDSYITEVCNGSLVFTGYVGYLATMTRGAAP
jgi:hypothetical protein